MSILYYWSKFAMRLQGKAVRGSNIHSSAKINYGSNVVNSTIDRYSYCGYDCWIIEADIGSFCSISNHVRIGGPAHPIDWVSTSPVFHKGKNVFGVHFSEHEFNPYKRTTIENDVWIGECAIIKAGVNIHSGAVIGAGSVVTKDVGAYEIWAGNPARLIRKRFGDETISELLASEWWNMTETDLKQSAQMFHNPSEFLSMGE